ncbi:hypothetical protein Cycma_5041 [Cyclobacterium marinum DSM 745]|uniref:Uncharacterized protein n=1 Tax=Cyclobacterium marinum (strain ATCC 25205 / DSM 745 / LMG 13164 / NCIMB 1802) TaxID=880070 RepID=G0J8C5_CYCMS|nr:hypothetical protein Cycma_5041 [Cyclobacterium marinum DSM 745]
MISYANIMNQEVYHLSQELKNVNIFIAMLKRETTSQISVQKRISCSRQLDLKQETQLYFKSFF